MKQMIIVSRKRLILLLAALLVVVSSCNQSNEPGKPEPEPEPFKHPNEMTWTIDTLSYPGNIQVLMNNILAFSADDIWLCGWGDAAHGLIWHYDGTSWEESDIAGDIGGMRVWDISGYSSDDIWGVGYSGVKTLIAHYNGNNWERKEPVLIGDLYDISSNLSETLWACGETGLILKYENGVWDADSLDIPRPQGSQFLFKSVEELNGTVHIIASLLSSSIDYYYYIRGNWGSWEIVDSTGMEIPFVKRKWGNRQLYRSNDNQLFSVGQRGVWTLNGKEWEQILDLRYPINGICKVSDDYILAVGVLGNAYFYNGAEWILIETLLTDPHYYYTCAWSNGYELFVIGHTSDGWPMNTVVWHGK